MHAKCLRNHSGVLSPFKQKGYTVVIMQKMYTVRYNTILFFEGYVHMLTYSILAYVNENRILYITTTIQ